MAGLSACGDSSQAKGGIWDETENGVAVCVHDDAGMALSGARVRLIPLESWSSEVASHVALSYDSALTDGEGEVLLHTTSWPAVLTVSSSLGISAEVLYAADSLHSVVPAAAAVLRGTFRADSGVSVSTVHVAGTTWKASVDSSGNFSFAEAPAGEQTLIAETAKSVEVVGNAQISAGDTISLGVFAAPVEDEVLLDDFSDEIAANRYFSLTGTGWWYIYADSLCSVSPSGAADLADSGYLSATFSIDSSSAVPFAMVGVDLEASIYGGDLTRARHDLSSLDSLTFLARGSGTMTVQIYSAPDDSSKVYLYTQITLTDSWVTYSLQPSLFINDAGLSWDSLSPYVSGIGFATQADAQLDLDDIILHGLDVATLYPALAINEE
ncbi:MAG TPA: hypothetical protein VLM37_07130 [Fibrobacteraceae bacterium]|nr:hypothetical protein [Fibrobacteraceae bacterium]